MTFSFPGDLNIIIFGRNIFLLNLHTTTTSFKQYKYNFKKHKLVQLLFRRICWIYIDQECVDKTRRKINQTGNDKIT